MRNPAFHTCKHSNSNLQFNFQNIFLIEIHKILSWGSYQSMLDDQGKWECGDPVQSMPNVQGYSEHEDLYKSVQG